MIKYDVLIVGAGLGSLTLAALLSNKGYKVGVFEKEPVTGGCSTTFVREKFEFDASIHWINNMELIQTILKRLNAEDKIEFKHFNPLSRIITPSSEIMLSYDIPKFEEELIQLYPKEKDNIHRFFMEALQFGRDINKLIVHTFKYMRIPDYLKFGIKYISNQFPMIKKYKHATSSEVVSSFFHDNGLKTLIHSLGTNPDSSVYPIFSRIAWANEQNYYYPAKGGGGALPKLLTEISKKNGVDFFMNTEVEKIFVENNKATGICVKGEKEYKGEYVVSGIDALYTYENLIGEENLKDGFLAQLKKKDKYPSFCMLSMGTDYDLNAKGYQGETITYNPSDDLRELMSDDLSKNRKFIHLRSMRDPSLAPEGLNTVSVGFRLPYEYKNYWMTGTERERGEEYYQLKEKVSQEVLENVEQVMPGLMEHIKVKDLATPITYERYTYNSSGSMMGWEESTGGIRRKEPIGNFQRVGHWSFPGGGTPRAMVSGMIVADLIERKLKK